MKNKLQTFVLSKPEHSMLNHAVEESSNIKTLTMNNNLKMTTDLLIQNRDIIKHFVKYNNLWMKDSPFSYLLLLADERGDLLAIEGDQDCLYEAETLGLQAGVSLTKRNLGSHALSGAIEYQRTIYLPKQDNYLDIFTEWNGISTSISSGNGELRGYIALMTPSDLSINHLYFISRQLSVTITHDLKMQTSAQIPLEERINITLLEYNLTNRERQITKYWILDYDYRHIGEILNISENTVRVFISKINQKINVKSKTSMVLKILLADNLSFKSNFIGVMEGYRE